jgi:hypothetical protein
VVKMSLRNFESYFAKKGEFAKLKYQLFEVGLMIIDERQDQVDTLTKLKKTIEFLEEIEDL